MMSGSDIAGGAAGSAEPDQGRVALVDALRGAAMLGIMLVNLPSMNTRAGSETTEYGGVHGALDRAVGLANMALCNGKFYPIFAVLFGWGLAVLARSRERLGERPASFLSRRLLVLLGFGALHVTLVWWGDILIVYALLGLVVIPCVRWTPRTLLWTALTLLLVVPLFSPLLVMLDRLGLHASDAVVLPGLGLGAPSSELVGVIYTRGSFSEMVRQRFLDYLSDFTPFARKDVTIGAAVGYGTYYAQLSGLFLLGMWAAKRDLATRLAARGRRMWALWWSAGLVASALTVLRYGVPGLAEDLYYYQGEALALLYVVCLALVFPFLGSLARAFEAVGRMSLTAYLTHTTLASLLLYGTGLGLYGRIGPSRLLPVSLACYALVATACVLWTRRFRLGPAEWVWRSLLHGRREPFLERSLRAR
jgi:uncharacterized protein